MSDSASGDSFVLAGVGVLLRDFRASDEEAFVRWAGDDAMYEYMAWRLRGELAARAEFARLLSHPERRAEPRRHWYLAIENKAGEFVGTTGFEHRNDGAGEFGWYLAHDFWNRGYATATTRVLLDFGFGSVGVARMTATCDPDNAASRRVLEKCGLSYVTSETVDTWRGERPRLRFSISAADWEPVENAL